MDARAVMLTPAQFLGRQRVLMQGLRQDLPDYGPPGPHLGGPWAKTKSYTGSLPTVGEDGPGGVLPGAGCDTPRGNYCIVSGLALGAGTTTVSTTKGGTGPAIIRQIEYWCDLATPLTTVQVMVKVSDDTDTTGGVLTTGVRVRDVGQQFDCNPMTQKITVYPNFVVPFSGNWFMKAIQINGDAAAHNYVTWLSYDLLT